MRPHHYGPSCAESHRTTISLAQAVEAWAPGAGRITAAVLDFRWLHRPADPGLGDPLNHATFLPPGPRSTSKNRCEA